MASYNKFHNNCFRLVKTMSKLIISYALNKKEKTLLCLMGVKSNCQHLKSTPIKTLPRYRFGFVIVVIAVLSITRSGKKA